jgi:hypothetical protein
MAGMIPDAEALIRQSIPAVRTATTRLYSFLVEAGCQPYVKTIYVGFEIDGVLVAALYPRSDHVEIAMALPESADSPILIDATHLTWRTLPVAALVRGPEDTDTAIELLRQCLRSLRSDTRNP